MTKEQLLTDLVIAYRDARKRIRNRCYQLAFEQNLESELVKLRDELWQRQWAPQPAEAFIVFRPVQREVFASQFRDRIVHHLLFNYIAPVMDRVFIRDSYSCRTGKGTSDAVSRLNHHIQSVTERYSKPAYVLKMDIHGYFMNICHDKLESILKRHLDRHWDRPEDREFIDYVIRTILSSDVTCNCILRGRESDWHGLPASKSLFNRQKGLGLPIGDLTSQLFSNVYLNELDQYVKRVLKCRHYGRYVDDFFIVGRDRDRLEYCKDRIAEYLERNLCLTINDKKTVLQPADWPVSFLGHRIHPYYMTPSGRVIHNFRRTISQVGKSSSEICCVLPFDGVMNDERYRKIKADGGLTLWHRAVNCHSAAIERNLSALNSYLGYLNHDRAFRLVKDEVLSHADSLKAVFNFDDSMQKAKIPSWYKHKYLTA